MENMPKTSAKINKATSAEAAKSNADTRGKMRGVVKKPWDKPVSQSFYQKLIGRVEEIFRSLGYARGWRDEFMKFIDLYLMSGECPQRRYSEEFILVMFYSLKGEIDAAVHRSAASRRRAAERRARKEADDCSHVEVQNRVRKEDDIKDQKGKSDCAGLSEVGIPVKVENDNTKTTHGAQTHVASRPVSGRIKARHRKYGKMCGK